MYKRRILFLSLAFAVIITASFSDVKAQDTRMKDLPVKLYSDDGDKFVIIGHRGASAYAPENTMTAFEMARHMGAEMIELDVLLSKDGVPVVIHDEALERTTNGEGSVSDYTVDELKKLDAGSWFDEKFRGEPIPTLDEVLAFAQDKISVNIEIKTEAVTDKSADGIEEKSLALVKKYGMEDYVIFSSFDYQAITHLNELGSEVASAVLYEKSQSGKRLPSELSKYYSTDAFNCSYRKLSNKWIKDTFRHQIPVFVYTVNDRKRMERLILKGVSGIFSDKPDVLKQVVEKLWETN